MSVAILAVNKVSEKKYEMIDYINISEDFADYFEIAIGNLTFFEDNKEPTVGMLIDWIDERLEEHKDRDEGYYVRRKWMLKIVNHARKKFLPRLNKWDKNQLLSFSSISL